MHPNTFSPITPCAGCSLPQMTFLRIYFSDTIFRTPCRRSTIIRHIVKLSDGKLNKVDLWRPPFTGPTLLLLLLDPFLCPKLRSPLAVKSSSTLRASLWPSSTPAFCWCLLRGLRATLRSIIGLRHIQYQGETLPLFPGISGSPGIT